MRNQSTSLLLFFLIGPALMFESCQARSRGKTADYDEARNLMVKTQIEARGISDDRVLTAMRQVPRHRFVPRNVQGLAYADQPLPIGEGQTISQPYIVALMTELLQVDSTSKVLEIGTGSGYQAAILGELVDTVFTIEIVCTLAERAENVLNELGYDNITVRCGDGYAGWKEHAPFDAVIVTCAPPRVPQPLVEQLAVGGRMVIPVGTLWQELKVIEKDEKELRETSVIPVRFVPMTGEGIEKGN